MKSSFVILCRHGQRAPGKAISPKDDAFWRQFCIRYEDNIRNINERFPVVKNEDLTTIPHDYQSSSFPYGYLTTIADERMYTTGKNLAKAFPKLVEFTSNQYTIYASNYRRTQMSAQFLVSGLFDELYKGAINTQTPIRVKSKESCPLTFYESNLETAKRLLLKTFNSDAYKQREFSKQITAVKDIMAAHYPSLAEHHLGFDWPRAYDLFSCYDAHNLNTIREELLPVQNLVLEHFMRRYWLYYQDKEHLSYFISSLIAEIVRFAESNHLHDKVENENNVLIYGAHDITLLALLMALGDSNSINGPSDKMNVSNMYDYWPDFGSTVVLEFQSAKSGEDDKNVSVKVHRDLKMLSCFYELDSQSPNRLKTSRLVNNLTLRDLKRILQDLSTYKNRQ